MTATAFNPHTLIAESRLGVLATIKSNGLPQLSPVTPFYDEDAGVIYVSMTEGRAKSANLRRDPRASLEVTSADGDDGRPRTARRSAEIYGVLGGGAWLRAMIWPSWPSWPSRSPGPWVGTGASVSCHGWHSVVVNAVSVGSI